VIATRSLESLARCRSLLARAPRFTLGFFQALACALEFLFRNTNALLRHVRQQARAFRGFRGSAWFAACLFHLRLCEAIGVAVSHKRRRLATFDKLSTECVHNYVDRRAWDTQRPSPSKNLRYRARVFAMLRS
jgi:hypothetical protein